jgi:hypothetical protein
VAEPKTRRTDASVTEYLNGIADAGKRRDCKAISRMMRAATGKPPAMWGSAIVGYDSYALTYADGQTRRWPVCGFSARAQNITLYLMPGFAGHRALLKRLGKFKTGKSCLYVKRLADVDSGVLERLIVEAVAEMRRRYPA